MSYMKSILLFFLLALVAFSGCTLPSEETTLEGLDHPNIFKNETLEVVEDDVNLTPFEPNDTHLEELEVTVDEDLPEIFNKTFILDLDKPKLFQLGPRKGMIVLYDVTPIEKISYSTHADFGFISDAALLTPCRNYSDGISCYGYNYVSGWRIPARYNVTDNWVTILNDEYYDNDSVEITIFYNSSLPDNISDEELKLIDQAYNYHFKNNTNFTISSCFNQDEFMQFSQFKNYSEVWFSMIEERDYTGISGGLSHLTHLPYTKKLLDNFDETHEFFSNLQLVNLLKIYTSLDGTANCITNLPAENLRLQTDVPYEDTYYVAIYETVTAQGEQYVFILWQNRHYDVVHPYVRFTEEVSFEDWVVKDFFFIPKEYENHTLNYHVKAAKDAERKNNLTLAYFHYNSSKVLLVNSTYINSSYLSIVEKKLEELEHKID